MNLFSQQFIDSLATAVAEKVAAQLAESDRKTGQRLYDLRAAAQYLGRTPKAVQHLVDRGIIPTTRLDGKVQIDKPTLDKVIADHTYYEC